MPSFNCRKCGQIVQFPKGDKAFHEKHLWECLACYTVIASKRYQSNVTGGLTLFSPMGSALGDVTMQEVVKRRYSAENTTERISFLTAENFFNGDFKKLRPVKFFWADVTSFAAPPVNSTWFSLTNEADAFAEQGHYPQLTFEPQKPEVDLDKDFVVLHLRNIKKAPAKNCEPGLAREIIQSLKDHKVVLVGNDDNDSTVPLSDNVIDLRKKLILSEIAYVCKNASLFIGKDSGIAHLAGCTGVKMICWGYTSRNWFPKVPEKQKIFFGCGNISSEKMKCLMRDTLESGQKDD